MKVIYLPLWYLCDFATRYKGIEKGLQQHILQIAQCTAHQAKAFDTPGGNIPVYTAGSTVYHTTRDKAGEYVCDIPMAIGIGNVLSSEPQIKLLKAPFVSANNHIAVVRDEAIVLTEFLVNVLKYSVHIETHFRGAVLRTACMDEILKIEVPVPEMWYQKQMVEWVRQNEKMCDFYRRQIGELGQTINKLVNKPFGQKPKR